MRRGPDMAAKRQGDDLSPHWRAYGNGPAPIISGSDRITDWTEVGKHVYRKDSIDTEPYVALFNGRQLKRRKGTKENVGPDEFAGKK